MYWYVLFVQTGREHKVESFLKEQLDLEIFFPFVPMQEILFKKAGMIKKELKPLFPGYVFIETRIPDKEFLKAVSIPVYASHDIISILKYSENEISMKESEKKLLLRLCNDYFCIESSRGIIEGDRIYITEGPLRGLESTIKKVNRHTRQTLIELEILGGKRFVSVPLEIVDKIS